MGEVLPHVRDRVVERPAPGRLDEADAVVGHVRKDPLHAVISDDRAQHVMAPHQVIPRIGEPRKIDVGAVELEVEARPDAAEGEFGISADPVGALHVGERERVESPVGMRGDGGLHGCRRRPEAEGAGEVGQLGRGEESR